MALYIEDWTTFKIVLKNSWVDQHTLKISINMMIQTSFHGFSLQLAIVKFIFNN